MTVAMAILAVVFAAIMPVFAAVRNHADTAGADSEMVQNARVLNEQLYRCLAQAKKITTMSASTSNDGYIEFQAADGTVQRCQRGSSHCIEYGAPGTLSQLTGPVQYLKFTCYDGNSPMVQTDVPGHVRLVTWEARLDSAGTLAADRIIDGACHLRVGPSVSSTQKNTAYDFATGRQGVDCFAYAGENKTQVPTTSGTPSSQLTSTQYNGIEVQDGALYSYAVSTKSCYAQMRFVFAIQEDKSALQQVTATWRGKGVNTRSKSADGANLYIWNYASGVYELLQASANTESLVTLTGTRSSTAARYVGGSGNRTVVLLVVSSSAKKNSYDETLYTDYVKLEIKSQTLVLLP